MGAEEPEGQGVTDMQKTINGITEQFQNLSNVLDGGVGAASDIVKSTTALAKDEAEKASGVAQVGFLPWISPDICDHPLLLL